MNCPLCKGYEQTTYNLGSGFFSGSLVECRCCGTIWAVVHGAVEIVRDVQEFSFLEVSPECVEGKNYSLVA